MKSPYPISPNFYTNLPTGQRVIQSIIDQTVINNRFFKPQKKKKKVKVITRFTKETQMNMKQTQNLLEQNVQLQKEKKEVKEKLDSLINNVDEKMQLMLDALKEIKGIHVNSGNVVGTEVNKSEKKEERKSMFIPTPEPNNLKSNISEIQKKTKETNLDDSIRELSKLQEKNGK